MPDLTCSNGVRGVEDQGSCCVAECGTCGGSGCPQAGAKPSQFFGASDCCSTTIQDEGDLCDVTGVAPCIVYKLESTGRENAPTSIEVPATVGNGTRGGVFKADDQVACPGRDPRADHFPSK